MGKSGGKRKAKKWRKDVRMERIRLMVVEDNTELRKMLTDYFSAKDDCLT